MAENPISNNDTEERGETRCTEINAAGVPQTSSGNVPEAEIYSDDVKDDTDSKDDYSTADEDSNFEANNMEKVVDAQKEVDERKAREDKLTDREREQLRDEAEQLKNDSNKKFQQSEFGEARDSYSRALDICPLCFSKLRSVLYSNRAACLLHLEEYEDAIKDCSESLKLNPDYLKPLKRRAELYEKADKLDESLADYKNVLEKDPRDRDAVLAAQRLPPLITERNEKLKTEMVGKLKDLGNLVLKPFGLSTDNFQLQQNEAGGYSVNFKQ